MIVSLDAVGLLLVENPLVDFDALVDVGLVAPAFHVNVSPFAIVATNTSPKLLSDQRPGSSVAWSAGIAIPQPLKSVAFVTVAPLECDAAVVPFVPLVKPVRSLLDLPEYVINSLPICIVPELGKAVALVRVKVVSLSLNVPPSFIVDVVAPTTLPPHGPTPHP
jgi:hypothetical protein